MYGFSSFSILRRTVSIVLDRIDYKKVRPHAPFSESMTAYVNSCFNSVAAWEDQDLKEYSASPHHMKGFM